MLRIAYRAMARLSPRLGQLARDTNATVNGWRFVDLKQHIDMRLQEGGASAAATAFSMSLDAVRLRQGTSEPEVRLAFVSNMPPEDTGIATCSFYSWLGHQGAVDIFCPVKDLDWFVANGLKLSGGGNGAARLLDVGSFLSADSVNHYRAVVVAVGNSDHCLYIHKLLKKIGAYGGLGRCVLYIHDPCLLNLLQKGLGVSAVELARILEGVYGRSLADTVKPNMLDWEVYEDLIRHGMLGPRWFRNFGIRRFLVNSAAAEGLLLEDLSGTDADVRRIFHPVFLPLGTEGGAERRPWECHRSAVPVLTVGTFGIPSEAKRTQDVIEAVRQLSVNGRRVRLVIAGYGVKAYASRMNKALAGLDVQLFDSPTDAQLIDHMREVDVAVQLRARNLGESSGIVPQLLMLERPVVVNAIGSFAEFGDAVISLKPDAPISAIAEAIEAAAIAPPSREAMRRYVGARSPERFREALLEAVSDLQVPWAASAALVAGQRAA